MCSRPERQQDRVGQEAAGKRRTAQGRWQEPRRVNPYPVSMGASFSAGLACFIFRFLKRPRVELRVRKIYGRSGVERIKVVTFACIKLSIGAP